MTGRLAELILGFIITNSAGIGSIAFFGAGGRNGGAGYIVMPGRYIIIFIEVVATAAGIDGVAIFCAGGRNGLTGYIVMIESVYKIFIIAVATEAAGIGGIATFRAGGRNRLTGYIVVIALNNLSTIGIKLELVLISIFLL